ncbi:MULTISPECIES: hypothetical protein [unclassified Ekhidna]|jgi:hypothetical protein|uniref:hypothetical protein n=1 Tax=unclassified Ekhidna TaxID=2632188 RepID=UPI0032E03320
MDKNQELYYDEINSLRKFRAKIETHAIYKEDLDAFSDEYEELVAQAKVITRVSDRLQKKLDNANMQIREQNEEIKDKNVQLADTVDQLAKAKVGRRASTILFTVAVVLFILEQVLLEPIIDDYFDTQFVSLGILGVLFLVVKFSEGALESYFMNREKKKILENEKNNTLDVSKS